MAAIDIPRYAFVEYETPEQATQAIKILHATPLDKSVIFVYPLLHNTLTSCRRHTIAVNKVTDIERYGREGRVDENYTAPQIEEFADREVSALFSKFLENFIHGIAYARLAFTVVAR